MEHTAESPSLLSRASRCEALETDIMRRALHRVWLAGAYVLVTAGFAVAEAQPAIPPALGALAEADRRALECLNSIERSGTERDEALALLSTRTDPSLVKAVFALLPEPIDGKTPEWLIRRMTTNPPPSAAQAEAIGWPRPTLVAVFRERLWRRVAANLPDDSATGDLFASLGAESRCTLQDLAIVRASNQAIVKASPKLQRLLWDFATAASPTSARQEQAVQALVTVDSTDSAWREALTRFAWEQRDTAAGIGLGGALMRWNARRDPDPRLAVLVLDRIRSLESEPGDPKRSDREMSRRILALDLVSYLGLDAPGAQWKPGEDESREATVARGEAAINAVRFEEARLREQAQRACARPYQPPTALQLPPVLPPERRALPESTP